MNKLADKIKNKKPVTIAFFGDSVTQGCFELRVAEGKTFEPVYRPWEACLLYTSRSPRDS